MNFFVNYPITPFKDSETDEDEPREKKRKMEGEGNNEKSIILSANE